MAQLRDTTIDGNLEVTGVVNLQTNKGIRAINPINGEITSMLYMSEEGDTAIGYGGFTSAIGKTRLYGNDMQFHIASAGNAYFTPYYKSGDVLKFNTNATYIRTSGYVTNAMKNVVFTIPLAKPIIGSPSAQVTESEGLVLRQNGNYTHGSTSNTYAKPTGYDVLVNPNVGLVVTAYFDVTTNAINNNPIGIYWNGTITLS